MSVSAPSKILFINRVYPPAPGATGQLLAELAPALAREGFDVTVLTATARSNDSTIQRVPGSEISQGVRIERVRGLPFSRASFWQRTLAYLALYPAFFWRALCLPRCDVLVTMTDPPLLLLLGPLIAIIKRCRLVHWAQDIYPELAEELGVLRRRGWITNIFRALSTAALRRQAKIISLSRCMKRRLIARGLPESAIAIIPNWAPASLLESVPPAEAGTLNPFRSRHHLEGKFVVMYSGNFGLAHGFDEILEAAQALQFKRLDVLFHMIGDGPRLDAVKAKAQRLGNVRFLPAQPLRRLSEVLGAADVHLVTMLPEMSGLVVPSKLYGILAAGRPCFFVGPSDSEAALLIKEHQCGEVISSAAELASAILNWSEHPQRLKSTGDRAREAAARFTVEAATAQFSRLLQTSAESTEPAMTNRAAYHPHAT